MLAAALLTATKKWFFLAVLGATIIVNFCMIILFPLLCMRCEEKYKDMPDEQKLLKQ